MMTKIARPALVLLLLYIITAQFCLNQSTLALFFGHSIALSGDFSNSFSPQIAVSGSNVYVVWTTTNITSSSSPTNGDIYFKRSTDDGSTFDHTVNLSGGNTGILGSPQIAVSGSNVYVVWVDNSSESPAIYFKKSTDDGDNFDETINLSNGIHGVSTSPKIAASGSNVYVVWSSGNITSSSGTSKVSDIYFTKSTDNGDNFDAKKNLSKNTGNSFSPQLAVSGSNVYVVWVDNSPGNFIIYFKKSTDNGDNFDAKKNISNDKGNSFSPQLAVSGSNLYVMWSDNINRTSVIYFRAVTHGGDNFDAKKNLSKNTGNSFSPQLAVSGSNVYVVWSSIYGIYFSKITDNGTTFTGSIGLYKYVGSTSPKIAVSGSNVYVVWVHGNTYSQILFRSSKDSGNFFSGIIVSLNNITANMNSYNPQIAVSDSNVYVVWSSSSCISTSNNTSTENCKSHIYFKRIDEAFFARNT